MSHMTKVRIRNRVNGGVPNRLSLTKVFIGDQLCGQIQNNTLHGVWYEVECYKLGTEVKLVTVNNDYLGFQEIEVFGSNGVQVK